LGKNFKIVPSGGVRARHPDNARGSEAKKDLSGKVLTLGMIRAAEYPFVLPFERLLREKLGSKLRFVIYNNGLEISRDLMSQRLDLGIAPVLSHFLFFSIGSPIKMLAPAGAGGSSILLSSKRRKSGKRFSVATTKLSTMELMFRSSIKEGDIPKFSDARYYKSPKQLIAAAVSGEVDATCIWEPYSSLLMKSGGFKKLERDDEDHTCCALAAGNHLNTDLLHQLVELFRESLDRYRKSPESYLGSYSKFMNFDPKLVNTASEKYSYPSELDHRKLARQFESAGIAIPVPSSLKDAVLPAN
jgi:predicted transcriptional regulator